MRTVLGILAVIALPVATLAQSPLTTTPITATPLMPPSVQYPSLQPAPPVVQPPADQTQSQPPTTQPQAAPTAPLAAPRPMQLTWLPQTVATLQVLDKVNAKSSVLTIKVGQQAQVGSLNIQVQACDSHPPDQPQDSAAYLTITDSRADASGFRGWVLANNPSVSMLQHPIYDVRVVACQA